jgi:hypothetical protein
MSQKIAKKHYEEAKTDDISSHSTHTYSMHINTRWEPPRTYTSSGFWPDLITHQADHHQIQGEHFQ